MIFFIKVAFLCVFLPLNFAKLFLKPTSTSHYATFVLLVCGVNTVVIIVVYLFIMKIVQVVHTKMTFMLLFRPISGKEA